MRKNQIKADGTTEYAMMDDFVWKKLSSDTRFAVRVVVLEVGVARTTRSSRHGYFSDTVNDGVLVKVLSGPREGQTQVVRAAEIRQTWEEYRAAGEAAREAAREARKRAELDRAARANAAKTTLDAILEGREVPWTIRYTVELGYQTGNLTAEQLAEVMALAYEAGRAAAANEK